VARLLSGSPCGTWQSRVAVTLHSYSVGLFTLFSSHDCSYPLAPRKSFDILALYKSDYYYYYKINDNYGPVHHSFKIFAAGWVVLVWDFKRLLKFSRDVAMATKFYIQELKLHKIEHNSGPVNRSFQIFAASVGLLWSPISILLPKF